VDRLSWGAILRRPSPLGFAGSRRARNRAHPPGWWVRFAKRTTRAPQSLSNRVSSVFGQSSAGASGAFSATLRPRSNQGGRNRQCAGPPWFEANNREARLAIRGPGRGGFYTTLVRWAADAGPAAEPAFIRPPGLKAGGRPSGQAAYERPRAGSPTAAGLAGVDQGRSQRF